MTSEMKVGRKVALKSLPKTLKRLVMDNGVRPASVSVTLTNAPTASYSAYWRNKVVGLGAETKHKTECEIGSDGEPNYSTEVEFARVAVSVAEKCGYMKSYASITVTGLTADLKAEAEAGEAGFLSAVEKMMDAHEWAMCAEGPALVVTEVKPEPTPEPEPYTLVEWLDTYA